MIKKILSLLKGKRKTQDPKKSAPEAKQDSPYTDEEAQKVKERLQGLGYID